MRFCPRQTLLVFSSQGELWCQCVVSTGDMYIPSAESILAEVLKYDSRLIRDRRGNYCLAIPLPLEIEPAWRQKERVG